MPLRKITYFLVVQNQLVGRIFENLSITSYAKIVMKLVILEIVALGTALFFAILWLITPEGPFEVLAFISSVISAFVMDFLRRGKAQKQVKLDHENAIEEINNANELLFSKVLSIIEEKLSNFATRDELDQIFPKDIKSAIQLLKESPDQTLNSEETKRVLKTLEEAYGCDSSSSKTKVDGLLAAKKDRPKGT